MTNKYIGQKEIKKKNKNKKTTNTKEKNLKTHPLTPKTTDKTHIY